MNKFSKLSREQMDEHLSNYLIQHWSYSGVRTFCRNEKDFEKSYIYGERSQTKAVSAIIGTVYDKAVTQYFSVWKDSGEKMPFDQLMSFAHECLNQFPANEYRPTKTPIEEQRLDALKGVNAAIANFMAEAEFILENIQEIVVLQGVYLEFVTLAGIDIPLPIKSVPDRLYISKDGFLCCDDDKAKKSFTDEKNVHIDCSKQCISYVVALNEALKRPEYAALIAKYPKAAQGIKYFNYYENKYTENKNGGKQVRRITIDVDEAAPVYERMLLEPVAKMLQAVSDPDYIYLINQDDNFCDKAELYDFWLKTNLESVDFFKNLTDRQRAILARRKSQIKTSRISRLPKSVFETFKSKNNFVTHNNLDMSDKSNSQKIEHRLSCLNFPVNVAHVIEGCSCDTYLIEVGPGVKSSSIFNFQLDIASALDVPSVRIDKSMVVHGGRSYLSVEVNRPQASRRMLTIQKGVLNGAKGIPVGRDNFGNEVVWDYSSPSSPHLLVAGATGSGKSVVLTTIIETAMACGKRVTILDPKYEFSGFTDRCEVFTELGDIEAFMELKVTEMNAAFKSKKKLNEFIILDEGNDCLARQAKGRKVMVNGSRENDPDFKTLEQNIMMIAQKGRAAGIHLVLSSQRWSVKVMTGDAKANFTTRLCLTVASGTDSEVMLDEPGAEKLNGKGDALFRSPELGKAVRIQAYMVN